MAAATTPSNTISSSLLFPSLSHLRVSSQTLAFPRRRGFSGVRAAQVNPSGSIDASSRRSMAEKIKEELNADVVTVKDAYGDGRHVSIFVVSSAFEGHSEVKRQRMVYKAIWEEIQTTVHAVDEMITHTPAEVPENK